MQPGSFQNKRLIVGEKKDKIFLGFGSHLISNILVMTRWRVSGNNDRGTGIPQPSWNAWTVMWDHEFTLAHGCLVIGYCFFQYENSLPHSLGMLGL